ANLRNAVRGRGHVARLEQARQDRDQHGADLWLEPNASRLHGEERGIPFPSRDRLEEVVDEAVERIEKFPEEVLVQVARTALERVLRAEEPAHLIDDVANLRFRLLESAVDRERALLRVVESGVGGAKRLLLPALLPFGDRGEQRVERAAGHVVDERDPLVLVRYGALDLDREGEKVAVRSEPGRSFLEEGARRLGARGLDLGASFDRVLDEIRLIEQRAQSLGAERSGQALFGLQLHVAGRDELLAVVGRHLSDPP